MRKIPLALKAYQPKLKEEVNVYKAAFSESAKILEFRFEEKNSSTTSYLIIDSYGQRIEPVPPPPTFPAYFHASKIRIPFQRKPSVMVI